MKRTIISGAVLALAIAGVGTASADKPDNPGSQSGFKVTGGGQIVTDDQQGPGDTVGFVAQRTSEDGPEARGQFQFNPRGASDNESAPTEKFHGVVTCLISGAEAQAAEAMETDMNMEEALEAGSARFGGVFRDDPNRFFTVDVMDNGQGGDAEDDMILVRITQEPCADNPEDEDMEAEEFVRLGRGNVKIHNNPDGEASALANAATAAGLVALAGR